MSIDMDLSASRTQASSFKRMAAQKKQGYDEMERAINQFALNSPMLTGAAYDAAKKHYTNVLIPLVKAGRLYTEAAERAVQKFPEEYVSQVDSVSLKESELNDKINKLRKQIEAKKAQQSQLRQLAAHLPSEERGSARQAQQGLSDSIAALEKAKKKLEKKRDKLQAFHRSSRDIFSDLDSLEQAINKGAYVAAHSFNGSTFVAPSKSDMDWLSDVKNYEKKLAEQEIGEREKRYGDLKEWNSIYKLYIKSGMSNFKSIWYGARISRLSDGTLIVVTSTGLTKKVDELVGFNQFVKEYKIFTRIGSKYGELTTDGLKILKETKLTDFDMLTKGIANRFKDISKSTLKSVKSNISSSISKPLTFGMKSLVDDAKKIKTAKGWGKVIPGINLASGVIDVGLGFNDSTNMAKKDGLKGGQIAASQVGGMAVDVSKVAVTTTAATVAGSTATVAVTAALGATAPVWATATAAVVAGTLAVKGIGSLDKKFNVTKNLKKGVNGIIKGAGRWFG